MLSGDDRGWGVVTEEKHLSAVGFQPSPPWFGGCRLLQWGGFVQEQEYEQQGGEGQLWEELQVKEETLPWPNRWAFDPESWGCTCVFGLILEITHWLFEKSVELPDVLVNSWDDRHSILPNFDTILSFSGLRKSCKPRCSLQRGLGRVASFLQGDFQLTKFKNHKSWLKQG